MGRGRERRRAEEWGGEGGEGRGESRGEKWGGEGRGGEGRSGEGRGVKGRGGMKWRGGEGRGGEGRGTERKGSSGLVNNNTSHSTLLCDPIAEDTLIPKQTHPPIADTLIYSRHTHL